MLTSKIFPLPLWRDDLRSFCAPVLHKQAGQSSKFRINLHGCTFFHRDSTCKEQRLLRCKRGAHAPVCGDYCTTGILVVMYCMIYTAYSLPIENAGVQRRHTTNYKKTLINLWSKRLRPTIDWPHVLDELSLKTQKSYQGQILFFSQTLSWPVIRMWSLPSSWPLIAGAIYLLEDLIIRKQDGVKQVSLFVASLLKVTQLHATAAWHRTTIWRQPWNVVSFGAGLSGISFPPGPIRAVAMIMTKANDCLGKFHL